MSQRTDVDTERPAHEFTTEYLYTLVGVTLAVLVVVFGIEHGFGPTKGFRNIFQVLFAFPWIVAGGVTIQNGLSAFGGDAAGILSGESYWGPLLPLLVIGVGGTTCFLQLMSSKEFRAGVPRPRRIAYLIGLIVSTMFFFTLVPVTFIQRSVANSMRSAQAVQSNKDAIINDLSVIAWKIKEYVILPVRYGGGDGDVRSFAIPDNIEQSGEATYFIEWEGDNAAVIAQSEKFNGSARVVVDRKGHIQSWSYSGVF